MAAVSFGDEDPPIEAAKPPELTPEEANWAMVRSSLAAMANEQSKFIKRLEDRLQVTDRLLVGRFDGIDGRLDNLTLAVEHQNELLGALNQIVSGMRSAGQSTYDMATSAARKIERVRQFLKVPDAVVEDIAEAPPDEPVSRDRSEGADR